MKFKYKIKKQKLIPKKTQQPQQELNKKFVHRIKELELLNTWKRCAIHSIGYMQWNKLIALCDTVLNCDFFLS